MALGDIPKLVVVIRKYQPTFAGFGGVVDSEYAIRCFYAKAVI
jgi:hypothetical protein